MFALEGFGRSSLVLFSCAIGVFVVGSILPVHAYPITFQGVVTFVSEPPVATSPGLFTIGDALVGSYEFDVTTLSPGFTPGTYSYRHTGFTFSLGAHSGSAPAPRSVYGDQALLLGGFAGFPYYCAPGFVTCDAIPIPAEERDFFLFLDAQEEGLVMPGLGSYYLVDFRILLEDPTNTAVPAPAGSYLQDPPDLLAFAANHFVLSFCAGFCPDDEFVVVGRLESIERVPWSSSLALLAVGAATMAGGALARRRRSVRPAEG